LLAKNHYFAGDCGHDFKGFLPGWSLVKRYECGDFIIGEGFLIRALVLILSCGSLATLLM
jgi:hypothetical protein